MVGGEVKNVVSVEVSVSNRGENITSLEAVVNANLKFGERSRLKIYKLKDVDMEAIEIHYITYQSMSLLLKFLHRPFRNMPKSHQSIAYCSTIGMK